MTVIEVVKKYELGEYKKSYKNCLGGDVSVSFNLEELAQMEVKGVYVNFPTDEAIITIRTLRNK